jgi:hypothetical protein
MDFSHSFPKLEYEEHGTIRRGYKYTDDLINPNNWGDNINKFTDKINSYIDERDRFADIKTKSLREIGLPLDEISKTTDVYQTISGDILNNRIFVKIGKIIEQNYEHYVPVSGTVITSQLSSNITDVDKLPKEVTDSLVEISSIGNLFSVGLKQSISPNMVEYHKKFIKDNNLDTDVVIYENPNLSKYGLYPEVIGADVARVTGNDEDQMSIAFTSGGLFGWKYSTPQQRTVGSAGDFGSIIIDVMFKLIKDDKPPETKIIDNDSKDKINNNIKYIFFKIKNYYETLMTSNTINELSKINDDVGNNTMDRNPVVLGVKRDEYRQPDIYALWCVYRSIRTPFYNRDKIDNNSQKINFSNLVGFFNYIIEPTIYDNIEFKPKEPTFDSNNVKDIKKAIINALKGNEMTNKNAKKGISNNSALLFDIENLITEFNVPITETTTLSEKSLQRDIIEKLEQLSNQDWFKIISQAFTSLYLSLFIAADTDWNNLVSKSGLDGSNIPFQRLNYNIQKKGDDAGSSGSTTINTSFNDRIKLIKLANFEYDKFRNTLKSLMGINTNHTMGGTSLMGENSLSLQKYGSIVNYPGDINILEGVSGYLTILMSDINIVEKRLQQALNNMSNMFWYRDILRWLEVLFIIFKPNEAPMGKSYSSSEIKAKFFKVEKILKILYSKQINIMSDYIQKTKVLQKRYETNGQINTSLNKKIKMSSYYNNSIICYIKRQIIIIYHLLDKSLESWWTTSPSSSERKARAISPAFAEADFKPVYRVMKNSLFNFFRGEVSRLATGIQQKDLAKEVRNLSKELCDDETNSRLVKKSISNVYLQDEKINTIKVDIRYWLLLIANLKNKDTSNIDSEIKTLQRLYLPVYTGDSKKSYYLFDIMPLILNGNYKGTFGGISAPQWLSPSDLERTNFSKNNPGIVILANTPTEVASEKTWQAISVEWFDKLVKTASESGNSDKKFWFIRNSLFILLNNSKPYYSPSLKRTKIGPELESLLQKYQEYTISNKEENKKHLMLVSREFIEYEMNNSIIQFHSL